MYFFVVMCYAAPINSIALLFPNANVRVIFVMTGSTAQSTGNAVLLNSVFVLFPSTRFFLVISVKVVVKVTTHCL